MYGIIGVAMIVLAIIINFTINRRRFNRRGIGGLQHFKNYSSSVVIRFFEGIGKLIGFVLFFIGIVYLVMWVTGNPKNHQNKIQKKEIKNNVKA